MWRCTAVTHDILIALRRRVGTNADAVPVFFEPQSCLDRAQRRLELLLLNLQVHRAVFCVLKLEFGLGELKPQLDYQSLEARDRALEAFVRALRQGSDSGRLQYQCPRT